MMNLNAEIKEKIIRVVHALVPKATIYLFGSRALEAVLLKITPQV